MSAQAEERLEGGRRRAAAIQPEGEFVEVDLQMLVADPVVSPAQPGLEVSEHPVDPRQQFGRPARVVPPGSGSKACASDAARSRRWPTYRARTPSIARGGASAAPVPRDGQHRGQR